MKTPWGQNKKPAYAKQEARISAKSGARAQVNSGRTWKALRDVVERTPFGLILTDAKGPKYDCDETTFRLTADEWRKLRRDANRTPPGCLPSYQIDLARDVRLRVIDEDLWNEIVGS